MRWSRVTSATHAIPRGASADDVPDLVVVGAAARDVDASDPRGWRLGGTVGYVALGIARLGLRVGALVGVDALAREAWELDLLRKAGVAVVDVPLANGPIFDNRETPAGRVQTCLSVSDRLAVSTLPAAWSLAAGYVIAPVAGDVGDEWAAALPGARLVALAWQGLLRRLAPGRRTEPIPPFSDPLVARADLIVVGRDDLGPGDPGETLASLLARPGQQMVVTAAHQGGLHLVRSPDGRLIGRRYAPFPTRRERDLTGAGDAFLAGWVAAEYVLEARLLAAGEPGPRLRAAASHPAAPVDPRALHLAAVVAALKIEGLGMDGLPDVRGLAARLRSPARA